tara:strand:- start:86 stop:781 length:696 start_codon:yes stop_codon:yes gene_type:complete
MIWPPNWVLLWASFPEANKTIGQTLPCHNQAARFNNSAELVKYICVDNIPTIDNDVIFTYLPTCDWPFINKGWGDDGIPGNDDLVFNDCSVYQGVTIAGYDQACMSAFLLGIVFSLTNLFFLYYSNTQKPPKLRFKRWYLPDSKPNINEQLLWLIFFTCICQTIRTIDFLGIAGRLSLSGVHTVVTGFCAGIPVHIGFLLVVSWITIVDGGKSKKTPPWARTVYLLAKWTS